MSLPGIISGCLDQHGKYCSACLYIVGVATSVALTHFSFQISELMIHKLNQNSVYFELKPGVQVLVHAAHLTAGQCSHPWVLPSASGGRGSQFVSAKQD